MLTYPNKNPDILLKQGDTLALDCTYLVDNAPAALPPTILSQVRDIDNTLIGTLSLAAQAPSLGTFTLLSGDTSTWPISTLYLDVQYTLADGTLQSSDTIRVIVQKDISRA